MTTANKIKIISPQPREITLWGKFHHQSIDFIAERAGKLNMYALGIAV
jgi:hypothetical protein